MGVATPTRAVYGVATQSLGTLWRRRVKRRPASGPLRVKTEATPPCGPKERKNEREENTDAGAFVAKTQAVEGDADEDALLVLAGGLDGHLQLAQRLLAQPVPARRRHLSHRRQQKRNGHPTVPLVSFVVFFSVVQISNQLDVASHRFPDGPDRSASNGNGDDRIVLLSLL